MEVMVVRGKASVINAFANRLIGAKGVKHGKLSITTTGKDLPA
jgi:CopG family nickel-responsive transcriptional regulator